MYKYKLYDKMDNIEETNIDEQESIKQAARKVGNTMHQENERCFEVE